MEKYIVKRARIVPAVRNPFRPNQRTRFSKWETVGKSDNFDVACRRACDCLEPGCEVRIYVDGKVKATQAEWQSYMESKQALNL